LQKSTSGVWSSRKAMGLALWLHPFSGWQLKGRKRAGSRVAVAKATSTRAAKPVAGSSRSHAFHAKARRATGGGSTRRWKASWSGEAEVFDETAAEGGPGEPKRWGCGLTAGSAEVRDRGRQKRRRQPGTRSKTPRPGGAARKGRRSWPRQDRVVPLMWAFGASLRNALSGAPSGDHVMVAASAEAGGSPSSEAPTWSTHPARRSGRHPNLAAAGAQAQGEPALPSCVERRAGAPPDTARSGRGNERSQEPDSP
jgi:hypothetical protein